jgi:hypothetical protein
MGTLWLGMKRPPPRVHLFILGSITFSIRPKLNDKTSADMPTKMADIQTTPSLNEFCTPAMPKQTRWRRRVVDNLSLQPPRMSGYPLAVTLPV